MKEIENLIKEFKDNFNEDFVMEEAEIWLNSYIEDLIKEITPLVSKEKYESGYDTGFYKGQKVGYLNGKKKAIDIFKKKTKMPECDNCSKLGQFQSGMNKLNKIGTWCSEKCFKQGVLNI